MVPVICTFSRQCSLAPRPPLPSSTTRTYKLVHIHKPPVHVPLGYENFLRYLGFYNWIKFFVKTLLCSSFMHKFILFPWGLHVVELFTQDTSLFTYISIGHYEVLPYQVSQQKFSVRDHYFINSFWGPHHGPKIQIRKRLMNLRFYLRSGPNQFRTIVMIPVLNNN